MRLAGLAALLWLAACSSPLSEQPMAEQWVAAPVIVAPIDLRVLEIGRLRFRGGLALRAPAPFGGISGLDVLEGGRLVAVTDNADWLIADILLDESGTLIGLANARMAFMRDETGAPFPSKAAGDAEALAQMPDGRFAVAFEQTQTIRIYDLNRDGPFGAALLGPILAGASRLRPNAGLEAMAADADGALIVGAEGGGAPTPLWRAMPGAAGPEPIIGRYVTAPGYSLTGLDRMPDGGFIALERFYAPIIGARARLTRFELPASGERIVGEELAELAAPMPIDNFEGIAAVRMGDGATRIYIISDDNFSSRQRTLLYAFDLIESEAAP
ncbi:MAG TPA: esterase-like activity of phytase family protein [Terricaulis sp.]|nr:esterase-like activity of phytase family protein [Terricaulis sp.]